VILEKNVCLCYLHYVRDPEISVHQLQRELYGDGPDAFAEVFTTNLISPYFVTVAFLPLLAAGNTGVFAKTHAIDSQIVAISSVHGRRTDAGISTVPYTLSKAMGEHLGGIMAALLADWRIRSNTILPGLFLSGELFDQYR
jgi:NAD(P)-dependent dehydrogenase (short-subunit alcohol dehydrogenase family)